jgi:arylsulfatase A-like enzyme
MARWPGTITPGKSDLPWAFWDVYPTLAEIAGGAIPEGADLDGVSIAPTLLGQGAQQPIDYLYFTWPGAGGGEPSGYAVRYMQQWKAVVRSCGADLAPSLGDAMELYHLPTDPFEASDVSAQHDNVLVAIKQLVISKNVSCHCYQC